MNAPHTTRKARFKAALALAGMTEKQWRAENGVGSRTHLNRVLLIPSESAPLTEKIDAFIAKQQRQLARAS